MSVARAHGARVHGLRPSVSRDEVEFSRLGCRFRVEAHGGVHGQARQQQVCNDGRGRRSRVCVSLVCAACAQRARVQRVRRVQRVLWGPRAAKLRAEGCHKILLHVAIGTWVEKTNLNLKLDPHKLLPGLAEIFPGCSAVLS